MLDDNTLSLVLHEPIGVVGQIIPWNFPFLMAAWKLAPALAAGDTIVLKPSSHTSLSVLELVRLIQDVLPKGVLNLITGAGSKSGQWLLDHPDLDKLAFTGSTEVGHGVYKAACDKLIPATLELGGKSANIISTTATWIRPSKAYRSASSSIRARSAAQAPAYSFRKASMTNSYPV